MLIARSCDDRRGPRSNCDCRRQFSAGSCKGTVPDRQYYLALLRWSLNLRDGLVEQAEELGATTSIDASLGDDHVRTEVARLTDDVGADLTVDAAGFVSTVENAVRLTFYTSARVLRHDVRLDIPLKRFGCTYSGALL